MPKGIKGFQKGHKRFLNTHSFEKGKPSWNKGKYIKLNNALEIWRKNGGVVWNKGLKGLKGYWTGKKRSPETIEKFRKSHLGKKCSEETKKRMSEAGKGRISPLKGKKHTEEWKQKMKEYWKNHLPYWKGKIRENMKGENNPLWKGGITPLYSQIRNSFKNRQWISDVFTKDNFICQNCSDKKGGNLEAHHIKPFSKIIEEYKIKTLKEAENCEELWNINNGITLCKNCHKKTDTYLKKVNL